MTEGVKRRVVFWSLFGDVRDKVGLEEARIVHIEGVGGTAVFRDSTSPRVSGRVGRRAKDANEATRQRKLEQVMIVREDDPTPISLQAGRRRNYQGSRVTKDERDRLKSNAVDFAIADHKRKGATKEKITVMLMWGFLLSIAICGVAWLTVQAFSFWGS